MFSQPTAPATSGEQRYLQFVTHYQHPNGQFRVRVTTLARSWVDGAISAAAIGAGFDQEAAAVVVARVAAYRAQSEPSMDVVRWIDRTLIRLASKFGDYRKDEPSTFQFAPQFSLFPQFMFHLRRSPLINVYATYTYSALDSVLLMLCSLMIGSMHRRMRPPSTGIF